ncbi:MAG: hypothetical protein AAF616_13600 [Bacteroidota bacterium]
MNASKLLGFCLLTVLLYSAQGQDLIVTTEGDSITCKITRISDDYLHFSVFDVRSGVLLMRSRLPLSSVKSYYQDAKEPADTEITAKDFGPPLEGEDNEYQRSRSFKIGLSGGYSYQFSGYDGLPRSYQKQVENLWNIEAHLHYFISQNTALGFVYSRVQTSADEDFGPPLSNLFGFSQLRNEKIVFQLLALSLVFSDLNAYDGLNFIIDVGSLKYRTDFLADGSEFFQEGNTIGGRVGLSYDIMLTSDFAIEVGAKILLARFSRINDNGTIVQTDFEVPRIDLSVGFSFLQ